MKKNELWTLTLIIIGVAFLTGRILKLISPMISSALWVVIILWGISIISGKDRKVFFAEHIRKMMFTGGETKASDFEDKYELLFCDSIIDFTYLLLKEKKTIIVESTFSKCRILINPNTAVIVNVKSSFCNVHFPDNYKMQFGERTYTSRNYNKVEEIIQIYVKATFSDIDIVEDKTGNVILEKHNN